MTDERLDQILKQALAPEIDESEITVKGKVRVKTMKRNDLRGALWQKSEETN